MRFASFALVVLFFSNVYGQTDSAPKLFHQSMVLFRQAKFEEMIAACDATIEAEEFAALATGLKAVAAIEQGEVKAANELIESALETKPEDSMQLSLLLGCQGFVEARQGRHEKAMESATQALKQSREHWFPHYVHAYVHYHRGQYQTCLDTLDDCLSIDPKQPMPLLLRGMCKSNQNNEWEAFSAMAGAMQWDTKFVWGAWVFAMELGSRGTYDTAAMILDSAEAVNENYSPVHTARAFLHQIQSEPEEQEACLDKAWELNDKHIESLTAKGFFLIQSERFDEAKPIVERCLECYPDSYHSYLMQGIFLSDQGQTKEALEAFEKAAEINPTHFRPHFYLGVIHYENEKYDEAVAPYQKAKELNPTYWFNIFNLGKTYAKLGQHKKAVAEFTRVLELVDDYGSPYAERAYSYEAIGEPAKAADDFEKAKELGWNESWRDE